MSFRYSWCELLEEDGNGGAIGQWRKKIQRQMKGLLLVIGLLVLALIVVSVELSEEPDLASLGGWGRWERVGQCSRECGGGERMEKRPCWFSNDMKSYCRGNSTRMVPCNQQPCQGKTTLLETMIL